MTRNLKALGVALVAVCALSAMAASASHATNPGQFTSKAGTYPLFLDATSTKPEIISLFGIEITCKHVKLTSTEFPASTAQVFFTPESTECHMIEGAGTFVATITHNGCEYRFYNATTEAGEDNYTLATDILCPTSKLIEVYVYPNETFHKKGEPICIFTIPAQVNLILTAHNDTANGDVVLSGTMNNLHIIQHRKSFLCPAGTTTTKATYALPATGLTVTGTDGAGAPNQFHIG